MDLFFIIWLGNKTFTLIILCRNIEFIFEIVSGFTERFK